jgi:DNA-binding PadR family transcriptional regulator
MRTPSPMIEYALLGFLRQRPLHGYAIYQQLKIDLGQVWQLKLSQLYALLSKLEEAGYVTAEMEMQVSRPPRKLFQLTADGEAVWGAWVQSAVRHGRYLRLEFLVKLYFARREGVAAQLLAAQRAQCQLWLHAEQAKVDESEGEYGRLVHQFRLGQTQAMLAWLDDCEEALGA